MGMLLIGSVPAAIVGFIMLTKPSLLRDLENSANRWISTDGLLKWINNTHYFMENSIVKHRKLAGAALILGSLYVLIALGYILSGKAGRF
ncbi:MAG: hypothetical protein NTY41_15600 [Proteobacteria bacterium]|nr:hypothetical protein [Pseudomonadota bacterium]